MGRINWSRVLLGGLLAGIVIDVVETVVNSVILKRQWQAAMEALGKSPQPGSMWIFIAVGFLLGLLAVWLYAAIRPRFGPGPKTALYAGLYVWALAYLITVLSSIPMGVLPNTLLLATTAVGLIEAPLGTILGAWVYKET